MLHRLTKTEEALEHQNDVTKELRRVDCSWGLQATF